MPEAQARAAISDEEVSALLEKNGADAVRPYDFAAQRINRMQLPLLEVVSKSFAERAGASLSTLLGRDAAMQFTSLESAKSADLQAAASGRQIHGGIRRAQRPHRLAAA